jgi:hypothetical protein
MPSHSPSNQDGSDKPNPEVYVADGDYIKDIEINDLRNRYTLTKGSTQKMVITPMSLADSPEMLDHACFSCVTLSLCPLSSVLMNFVWSDEAYTRPTKLIASHLPSVASADLGCVISRSKMRLAPVRLLFRVL